MPPSRPKKPYEKPSPIQLKLQKQLAIGPKTAGYLILAGYNDYRDLRHVSPSHIVSQLASLPSCGTKSANTYRRPLRRMVWLGTQDEPEIQAAKTAHPSYWTMKGLTAKGLWQEDYDDLTGDQVQAKFLTQGVEP